MIVADAIAILRPGARWSMLDANDLSTLIWVDEIQSRPTDDEILQMASQSPPRQILSQDLMAQFTADDAGKIQAAISGNIQFWLLWQAMTAQKDPMIVTNARFQQGWSALTQVLGADRMTAIAAAVGLK